MVDSVVLWLADHLLGILRWIGEWLRSPGFGGVAAVVAASIAYRAATKTAQAQSQRANEDQWWDQARWAVDKIGAGSDDVEIGVLALQHLAESAQDAQAAAFVLKAVFPVLGLDPSIEEDWEEEHEVPTQEPDVQG